MRFHMSKAHPNHPKGKRGPKPTLTEEERKQRRVKLDADRYKRKKKKPTELCCGVRKPVGLAACRKHLKAFPDCTPTRMRKDELLININDKKKAQMLGVGVQMAAYVLGTEPDDTPTATDASAEGFVKRALISARNAPAANLIYSGSDEAVKRGRVKP